MPNLVGIGNSQVPTNAMLGGLAYQDPNHAILRNFEPGDITAIDQKKTIQSQQFLFIILQMTVMEVHGEKEHRILHGIMNHHHGKEVQEKNFPLSQ